MSSSNTNNQNSLDIEEGDQPRLSTLSDVDIDVEQQQTMPATPPPSTNIDQSNQPSGIVGLEQVDDDDSDMPLPMGMAEVISNRAEPPKQKGSKIEQLEDDNGPEPPTVMLEDSLNDADKSNKVSITASLSSTNNNDEYSPPMPFNSAEFEDTIAKKKAKDEMNRQPAANTSTNHEDEEDVSPPSDRDSIYEPPREVIEGSEGMSDNTNTGRGGTTNRRGWDDIGSGSRNDNARDIESQTRTNNHEDTGGSIDNDSMTEANVEAPTSTNQEGLPEVEAYLVEEVEEEVYIATPTLPWWKQKRARILLGVALLLLGAMAIALGVTLSRPNSKVNMIVNSTIAPSVSLAPSSSSAPSFSPTKCFNKIISNKQEINLKNDMLIDNPRHAKVTVDGRNMVVVAYDGKYSTNGFLAYDGPAFITFYLLDNNDEWQRVQAPIRVDDVTSRSNSVALFGGTAFIGFRYANDGAGDVLEYKQNDFDEWERVKDPFVHTANTTQKGFNFGDEEGIDIDGDIACVAVKDDRYLLHTGVNIYHKDESKWVHFDTIEGRDCSISGDIIAVYDWSSIQLYMYNQDENEIAPIQDPIPTGSISSMDLSNDYLVYSEIVSGNWSSVLVYNQNEANQTFTLQQQLNITSNYTNSLALDIDNDILVVGSYNYIHIYSLQDDTWEEVTSNGYLTYKPMDLKISGRTLITTDENDSTRVNSYNIQDCTQDMPTQSPTLSPTTSPTVSSPPTTTFKCFGADDGGGLLQPLYNAVRAYVRQDCANNQECDIGQTYGWPMNSWCVGSVLDMSYLFYDVSTFNEDVNGWNTSSAVSMHRMFWNATVFNAEVSNFDTSSVTDMNAMFADASSFKRDLSNFNTSSVTTMEAMFSGASLFNGDLSSFDTSSVTNMYSMFFGATSFNRDLSSFDTSSVTDMSFMFASASSFNQDLCSWQDTFPYTAKIAVIFLDSNCTYQDTPQEDERGPFCASDCGSTMSPTTPPTTAQLSMSQSPNISNKPTSFPTGSSPPQESSVLTITSPPSVTTNISSPPVASPDISNLSTSDEVFVSVLDNDTPAAGQTLSINSITTQASNGICSIGLDLDEVIYEPNPGFTGFDSCVYEACDSALACDTATLTVIVVGT